MASVGENLDKHMIVCHVDKLYGHAKKTPVCYLHEPNICDFQLFIAQKLLVNFYQNHIYTLVPNVSNLKAIVPKICMQSQKSPEILFPSQYHKNLFQNILL